MEKKIRKGMVRRNLGVDFALTHLRTPDEPSPVVSNVIELADYIADGWRDPYAGQTVDLEPAPAEITASFEDAKPGEEYRCGGCGKTHTKLARNQGGVQASYGFEFEPPSTFKQLMADGTKEIVQPGTSLYDLLSASVQDHMRDRHGEDKS